MYRRKAVWYRSDIFRHVFSIDNINFKRHFNFVSFPLFHIHLNWFALPARNQKKVKYYSKVLLSTEFLQKESGGTEVIFFRQVFSIDNINFKRHFSFVSFPLFHSYLNWFALPALNQKKVKYYPKVLLSTEFVQKESGGTEVIFLDMVKYYPKVLLFIIQYYG